MNVRLVGVRSGLEVRREALFDVDLSRNERRRSGDGWGDTVLEQAQWGLCRIGKTREVLPWPTEKLRPDVRSLLT